MRTVFNSRSPRPPNVRPSGDQLGMQGGVCLSSVQRHPLVLEGVL